MTVHKRLVLAFEWIVPNHMICNRINYLYLDIYQLYKVYKELIYLMLLVQDCMKYKKVKVLVTVELYQWHMLYRHH